MSKVKERIAYLELNNRKDHKIYGATLSELGKQLRAGEIDKIEITGSDKAYLLAFYNSCFCKENKNKVINEGIINKITLRDNAKIDGQVGCNVDLDYADVNVAKRRKVNKITEEFLQQGIVTLNRAGVMDVHCNTEIGRLIKVSIKNRHEQYIRYSIEGTDKVLYFAIINNVYLPIKIEDTEIYAVPSTDHLKVDYLGLGYMYKTEDGYFLNVIHGKGIKIISYLVMEIRKVKGRAGRDMLDIVFSKYIDKDEHKKTHSLECINEYPILFSNRNLV